MFLLNVTVPNTQTLAETFKEVGFNPNFNGKHFRANTGENTLCSTGQVQIQHCGGRQAKDLKIKLLTLNNANIQAAVTKLKAA